MSMAAASSSPPESAFLIRSHGPDSLRGGPRSRHCIWHARPSFPEAPICSSLYRSGVPCRAEHRRRRAGACLPACLPPASRFLLLQGWAMQQPRAPRQFSREGLPWPEQVSQAGLNLQGTCKVAAGKKGNRPSVRRQKGSERATPGCQNSALPACCLGSAAEGSSRLGPLFHCFGGGSRSPRWHAKGGGQWGRAWQRVGSRNSWKGGKI